MKKTNQMIDRLDEVYQRLRRATQAFKIFGTSQCEADLKIVLDDAQPALVFAEAADVGGLAVRLLHEQASISATILKVQKVRRGKTYAPHTTLTEALTAGI